MDMDNKSYRVKFAGAPVLYQVNAFGQLRFLKSAFSIITTSTRFVTVLKFYSNVSDVVSLSY